MKVRATPVSYVGIKGTGTEQSITPAGTKSSPATSLDTVQGLQVAGQPNDTNFYGPDVLLTWNAVSGANDYVVKVYDGASIYRRTFYPGQNSFLYSHEDNAIDGITRSLTFLVWARAGTSSSVTAASLSVNNPIPAAVTISRAVKVGIPIVITITKSTERDVTEYHLYASQTNGFTPSDDNEIYRGAGNFFSWQPTAPGPWYFKACAQDSFGGTSWNYSTQVQNTLSAAAITTALTFVDAQGNPVGNIGSDNYRGASVDNALAYFGHSSYADGHGCKGEVNAPGYAGLAGSNQGSGPGVKGYSAFGAGVETTNYFRAQGYNGVLGPTSFTVNGGATTVTVRGGIIVSIV